MQVLVCYVEELGLIERQTLVSRHWASSPFQGSTAQKKDIFKGRALWHLYPEPRPELLHYAMSTQTSICCAAHQILKIPLKMFFQSNTC